MLNSNAAGLRVAGGRIPLVRSAKPRILAQTTPQSISMTVTSSDGTNTGTVRLWNNPTITTTTATTNYAVRSWTLQGAGLLQSNSFLNANATYFPPKAMPSNPVVTIICTLAGAPAQGYPAVSTSYTFTLVNPVPVVTGISSGTLISGASTSVTLVGTGFVQGTGFQPSIGSVVGTTYISPTSITAQVALPAGAAGNVSLTPYNPAPGGGTGALVQVPILSVGITATDPDGTNTGTARLGVPVSIATTVNNSPWGVRVWTFQGAGKFQSCCLDNMSATYTPPQTMPSNPNVTISFVMDGSSLATATYSFVLQNPIPAVTSVTPTQLLTGGTQQVSLVGSGFEPGTVVLFNGASLPIKYISYTQATVNVPVPGNAAGTLSLQVANPSPGGGSGNVFTESVVPNSITLTATTQNGINTFYTALGSNITMSAVVTGSEQSAINWSVNGAGSISSSGVYTPPALEPTNRAVTITAALASNPAIKASYPFSVLNPIPQIWNTSQVEIPAGQTSTLTVSGTNFVPGVVIQVNGTAVNTTYQSWNSVVVQFAVGQHTTGNLALQAMNPSPGGGFGPYYFQSVISPVSATAAARVLDQTTFGPTNSLIQHVQGVGVTSWLAEQYNTPQTLLWPIVTPLPSYCGDVEMCVESEWWQTALTGNDQLRQRVAMALSEIFVVSAPTDTGEAIDYYANLLAKDAFSNWYTIMNDVTLSPAMADYLNMIASYAPTATQIANENFARENLQLFSIGLNLLNQDGTLQLDSNGNPIPAYTQAQVQAFARAFTGWGYANPDGSNSIVFIPTANYVHQLVPAEQWHDSNPKTLLNGTTLPGGQTAEADLAGALTNVFNHPNLPPFVCRQLIQHLVTSNPSPAYVSRVAAIFKNNHSGVRGDMQAVLTAIFTDPEARAGDNGPNPNDGHLREPILWTTAVMRGLGYTNIDPNFYYQYLSNYTGALSQWPYQSPSVFNFFPPGYVIPGTQLSAPEFGIENTASVSDRLSLADMLVHNNITGFNVDLSATSPLGQIAVKSGPAALVDALGSLFLYGEMDANTRQAIINEISTVTDPAQQVRLASYLVITSSEYKILH